MIDQLADFAFALAFVCLKKKREKKNKNKADGGCLRWTLSVTVKPNGASYAIFWQANLISGLFMLLSLQPGVSESA